MLILGDISDYGNGFIESIHAGETLYAEVEEIDVFVLRESYDEVINGFQCFLSFSLLQQLAGVTHS